MNYSKASKECFTSQPNLSRQISSLENELGYLLFVRNKHQVMLTSAGEIFLKHAQNMWTSYQNALSELEHLVTNDPIRFGVMLGIQELLDALYYLIDSKKFPEIKFYHVAGQPFLDNDTVDICYTVLQNNSEPYSMAVKNIKAPLLVPKRLFPEGPPASDDAYFQKTFLVPEKEMFDVVQQLEKKSAHINSQTFKCVIFDFECYLLDLKLNNYIGFMINDSLGKYEDDFWVVESPTYSITLPIGVQWNPKKDELCRKVALGITKYLNQK